MLGELATAMIDISDGIAADAARLAEASGCGAVVELGLLPLAAGASAEQAASGGEDFELLAALPPGARSLVPVTVVGLLTEGSGRSPCGLRRHRRRAAGLGPLRVNPILGGSIASILWGLSAVVVSRSTRIIGAQQVVAWVLILGLAMVAPVALYQGLPAHVSNGAWAWVILSGVTANVGLLMLYKALHIGKVGVVTPIASTEGAIAAILSVVILGESLVGRGRRHARGDRDRGRDRDAQRLAQRPAPARVALRRHRRAPLRRGAARRRLAPAMIWGRTGRSPSRGWSRSPSSWAPLALRGGMGWPRGAWWMVAFSGMCEVVGLTCFVKGSEQSVAITAVLGSQYAAVAAVASFLILGERLSRRQVAGVVLILAGVTVLAAIQS